MPRISRRAPLLVGAVLAVLVAVPVAADTTGGPINVDYAYGSSADGNSTVQVSHDYLAGEYHMSASTQSTQAITCDDGVTTGELDVSIFGDGTPSSFHFDKKLASASASGTIAARTETLNTCTWEESEGSATMTVSMSFVGSKYVSTTSIRTVSKNPDGTTTTYDGKYMTAVATGTFSIDGVKTTASDARIEHDEMTVKTK